MQTAGHAVHALQNVGKASSGPGLLTELLLTSLLLSAFVPSFAVEQTSSVPSSTASTRVLPSSPAGCNKQMNRANRLAVLDELTTRLETELTRSPGALKDDTVRDRMGTFIAGSMHDDLPFISLDRWCWADFYEARRLLSKGDDAAASQSASDWKVCLAATFPSRMDLARPYLACFPRNKPNPRHRTR